MGTARIDGKKLKEMLVAGASALRSRSAEINDLNVFPVPDGDTGTNMTMTLEGGLARIANADQSDISLVAEEFSRGALLGARGNSGVILSQIFAGIREGLSGLDSASAAELAQAYRRGIERSYSSVMNPTEGTILTVFRESTELAADRINSDSSVEDFYRLHIEEAARSLERTKELLPVLADADVVDSGAAGYLCVARGMYESLTGERVYESYSFEGRREAEVNIDSFTRDSVLEFGYCTEFLLRLTTEKTNPDTFEVRTVIDALTDMGGESIVAYKEGDVLKVHVHTFAPGDVLSLCQRFGEFLTVKIENMSVGHTEKNAPAAKKKQRKPYSVLAVVSGEGIRSLFMDMGADEIVSGGQTSNPSTEEFIEAFGRCESENIIVLPNNKNVFLAANQAAELYSEARVHIIPTANVMQGYAALSVITPGVADINSIVDSAKRAAAGVIDGEITCAVRDVTINGKHIARGDYIAISGGEINAVSDTADGALIELLSSVSDMDDYEIITLFVGREVDDEGRVSITERIEELYPDHELVVYKGGQEVYDYFVCIE